MTEELAIHSNVTCIPQEDFDKMRGYYYYASYDLLKTIKMLKDVQIEYNEDGTVRRGHKQTEEYIFTKDELQDMLSMLEELEFRLRKMFVIDEVKVERMKQMNAEGKMKGGGRKKKALTLRPHTRRRK
jgi:hypothetical protein